MAGTCRKCRSQKRAESILRANGNQLKNIAVLIEADVIKPLIDQVYPFGQTNAALLHVESGRAKGKVVIKVK